MNEDNLQTQIAKACLTAYDNLGKKGKPLKNKEWTTMAAFVQTVNQSQSSFVLFFVYFLLRLVYLFNSIMRKHIVCIGVSTVPQKYHLHFFPFSQAERRGCTFKSLRGKVATLAFSELMQHSP